MAAIEDIMARTGASRRTVKEVAKGMGFEPANEYPNEVEAWVFAKMQSALIAKERPPAAANDAATVANSTSVSNQIEQDRVKIDTQAQYRAAELTILEDALTAYYQATENFTVPGLKEKVEHSRKLIKSIINKHYKQHYDIDTYLSQLSIDPKVASEISHCLNNTPDSFLLVWDKHQVSQRSPDTNLSVW